MLTLTHIAGFASGGTPPDVTPPTITSSNTASVAENATLAHALTADEAVTWTIIGGADASKFEDPITGSTLQWLGNGTKDFEAPDDADADNDYVVQVRATDAALNTSDQTITVTVTDIALWTPANDPNLFIWYKGEDLSGAHGSTVTTWPDAAGSNDATSGSATLDTSGLNGLNVVDAASASSQRLTIPNVFSGVLTEGAVYAVVKANADPAASSASSGGFLWASAASHVANGSHHPFTDGVVYDGFGSTVRKTCGNPTPSLAAWAIISFHSKAGSFECYVNGTLLFSTATNTVGWTTTPNLFQGASAAFYNGKMAESVFLDNFGDTTSRETTEGYLAHRFDIASVLDAGHPYKASPPTA